MRAMSLIYPNQEGTQKSCNRISFRYPGKQPVLIESHDIWREAVVVLSEVLLLPNHNQVLSFPLGFVSNA